MPSVSMPTAPAMPSAPSVSFDSKFYIPQTSVSNRNYATSEKKREEQQDLKAPLMDSTAQLKRQAKTSDVFSEDLDFSYGSVPYISASDISSLGAKGLLGSLYGLQDRTNSLTGTSTDNMLANVMRGISELKKEQEELSKKISREEPSQGDGFHGNSSGRVGEKYTRPAILRFVINGHNVSDSFKTVYFSQRENDGSFLLTADRRYLFGNGSRNETFYFLFKSDGSGGSSRGYTIEPVVVQDYKNENSLVYKFCQKDNLRANKIGNLVTAHSASEDLSYDILLDIGE